MGLDFRPWPYSISILSNKIYLLRNITHGGMSSLLVVCTERIWNFFQESLTQTHNLVDIIWQDTELSFKRKESQILNAWLGSPWKLNEATRSAWKNSKKAAEFLEDRWVARCTRPFFLLVPSTNQGLLGPYHKESRMLLKFKFLTESIFSEENKHNIACSVTQVIQGKVSNCSPMKWWRELWKAVPEGQIWWAPTLQAPARASRASHVGPEIVPFPRTLSEFWGLWIFSSTFKI